MDKQLEDAVLRLSEASKRAQYRRDAEAQGRRLEQALVKAFREQGKRLLRGLRDQLRRFFETASPSPAAAFEAHAAFLTKPLRENASENDWLLAWIEVEQDTEKMFIGAIDAVVAKSLEAGALAAIASLKVNLSFKLSNPRAVHYLDKYGAELVKGLNETTKDDLRSLISNAAAEGWSWKRLEEEIGDQFSDYMKRNGRAHLIAMTEIGEAFSEGNFIVAWDLQSAGLNMEKKWDPAGDGCVEICKLNADVAPENDGWIPLDQQFPSGHFRPLGHPGCWCDMFTRLVKSA